MLYLLPTHLRDFHQIQMKHQPDGDKKNYVSYYSRAYCQECRLWNFSRDIRLEVLEEQQHYVIE